MLQSCSGHASHWVRDVKFESMIAVWVSVFLLKIADAQLVVARIYATAFFGNEGPASTLLLRLQELLCTFILRQQKYTYAFVSLMYLCSRSRTAQQIYLIYNL